MCVKNCEICKESFEGTNSQRYCNAQKCRKILFERKVYYERYPNEKPIDYTQKVQGEPNWRTISKISETIKVGKKETRLSGVKKKCSTKGCEEKLGRSTDEWCQNCYSLEMRGTKLNATSDEWLRIESKPYKR